MTELEFKQFITESKYFTKYEVILDKNNLEIYGYEALSRFDIKNEIISTEEIFRKLHHNNNLFFELEKRNKKLQLDNFLLDYKLFLNFDADIVKDEIQQEYWGEFLVKYNLK